MAKPNIETCPACGEPLEDGFLSFLAYLKWCETKPSSWHGLQGKLVAGRNRWMRHRNTPALRCKKCELMLLKSDYPTDGD